MKIRVLVVEDSVTVRNYLSDILSADPGIEVVGEAEDGKRAIELCLQHRPHLITMDMMLPVMTGLAATEYIMAHCPTPILIVSASVNRGELFRTYEALAAGAVDVLEKPTGTEADGVWECRFLATVKLVARIRVITHLRGRLAERSRPRVARPIGNRSWSRSAHRPAVLVRLSKSCGACLRVSGCRSFSSCTSTSRLGPLSPIGSTGRRAGRWPTPGTAIRLPRRPGVSSWPRAGGT
jgi:two-component system, chemotaxis family, protein-glutamate methylesterase/glutaminase